MSVGKLIQKSALLLVMVIISCSGDDKTTQENPSQDEMKAVKSNAVATLPTPGSTNGDTINISGKFVLFFGPEITTNSSPQQLSATEITAFKKTCSELMDSLSTIPKISTAYSNAQFFRIYMTGGSSMVISKKALNTEAGVLVTDGGQPPTIKKGVLTSAEYLKVIREYFFLK